MVLKMLIRNGFKPRGDIILAATADEEAGGAAGAEYLLNHYPEKVLANYVLNEGGGSTIAVGGKRVFTVNTAEKGLLWLRVKAKGTPGHGSVPDVADNAILRINKIVERLGNFRGEFHIVPTMRRFLKAIAEADIGLQEPLEKIQADPNQTNIVLNELEKTAPTLADEIRPRMQITITPTIISGGVKENVIPSECMAVFDCRVLPGETIAQTQELIQRLLYDMELDKLSFEVIQEQEPSESPVETPLFGVIHDVLKDFEPDCRIAPSLTTGGTDSRFFRRKGSVCYGFHPLLSETKQDEKATRREHGIDERISVENLVFGASVLYETVRRFMS
jgi:acetylornithine deacetylase/succinyl-diaminopimelate desuccinylase-like protein